MRKRIFTSLFLSIFLFTFSFNSIYVFAFENAGLVKVQDVARTEKYSSTDVLVKYKKHHVATLAVDPSKTVLQTISDLKKDPNIEYVEPDYTRNVFTISSNDTDRALLWGLDNTGQTINGDWGNITGTANADISAPEAWAISDGSGSSVIVAVIDDGVSYTHTDLLTNMWDGTNCKSNTGVTIVGGCLHGYDYQGSGDNNPLPTSGNYHATHVSGIIGAVKDNNAGVIGIAPNSKIMALRFGTDTTLSVSKEVEAIDFAIQNGAKIINASFGGPDFSQAEYDAISRFKDAGGIFVAAAGNDGTSNDITHDYPSDYDLPNIISVAATDQNDNLTSFSNFGTTSVDVGAPGENILSTFPNNAYAYLSGTSMATPYTAGLAALIWGYKSNLTYTQVKSIILNDGDPLASLDGKILSGKRINAQRSLFDADIITAQATHDAAVEGTNTGQYEVGSKAIYQTAIDAASTVKNNVGSTPTDIATGVTNLDAATATFIASVVPADFTALNSAISSAQSLHDGATESTTPGDHVVGSKAILQSAIDAASALPGTSSQVTVDAMVVTLNAAITTFNSSLVSLSNISALTMAITSAQTLHDMAVEGTAPGQYAVGSKATLQSAIDTASALTNTLPQSTIDAGLVTLNTAVATFTNGIVDNTPPVITLLGSSSVTVKFGVMYTDAGATALDNKDGDITSHIVVVNTVDTHVHGVYTVTYNVSDAAGNPATEVDRTVTVSAQSSGGGGGGGGGSSSSSVDTTVVAPSKTPTVPLVVLVPSDCLAGYLFSPSTGKPCNSSTTTTTDPARYLLNTTPTSTTPYVFSGVLKIGMSGANVLALQKYLNTHGFIIAVSGLGSVGNESVYFGQKTNDAVVKFQIAHNLTPDGVVGPMTAGLMK